MMYRMSNLVVMRLVVLLISVAVIGCGREETGSKKTSGRTESITATVSVAAAADFKYAMDELVVQFEQRNPHIDVRTTYGSWQTTSCMACGD